MASFEDFCHQKRERVEQFLERLLPPLNPNPSNRLPEALRYALLQGGKRLRPILVYATGEALGYPSDLLDAPAASVECIHSYSLVHDDLPAMDNDDFRRGKPSCHKAFDEATAILVGDALQTLAFHILSDPELLPIDPNNQLQMLQILAQKSGEAGMIGGQALDIAATNQPALSLDALYDIHHKKTGALIEAAVILGALATTHPVKANILESLKTYARCIGLSFQIQDDILDVTQDSHTLGKTAGKDQQQNKSTFPSLIGLEASKVKARELHKQAIDAIAFLGDKGQTLAKLSEHFISRIQ